MQLHEIDKKLKVLNAKQFNIEMLLNEPNVAMMSEINLYNTLKNLNEDWFSVQNEIDELLELIDNYDFSVEEV